MSPFPAQMIPPSSLNCFPTSFQDTIGSFPKILSQEQSIICNGIFGVPLALSWAAVCPLHTSLLGSLTPVASTTSWVLMIHKKHPVYDPLF